MKELVIKKCKKCKAVVKVIKDCTCDDCGIKCCNESMVTLVPNSTDASFEKHVPEYEINDNKLKVTVNHVMEDNHYIEWIALVTDKKEEYYYFNPGEEATCSFDIVKEGTIYSYCNTHGLWKKDIK